MDKGGAAHVLVTTRWLAQCSLIHLHVVFVSCSFSAAPNDRVKVAPNRLIINGRGNNARSKEAKKRRDRERRLCGRRKREKRFFQKIFPPIVASSYEILDASPFKDLGTKDHCSHYILKKYRRKSWTLKIVRMFSLQ